MFTRSNWGLTNRARFTGASYTVYVEGGGGNPGQGSDDVIFWKAVFVRLRPDLAITVRPLGGKPQLESIAQKVASGQIQNTIVAMDADFDSLLGEKIVSPKVIYSYGYSWENDALTFDVLEIALERLIKVDSVPANISNSVKNTYRHCLNKLLKFVNADFYLRMLRRSLFPSVSSGKIISNIHKNGEPTVDLKHLRKIYLQTILSIPRADRICRPNTTIIDPQVYLQGHTLLYLARKVISYGVKLSGRNFNINDDILIQAVIPAFSDHGLMKDRFLHEHYTKMLLAI